MTLLVRLFKDIIVSTVVLKLLAIVYSVSPCFTVYSWVPSSILIDVGTCNNWPIVNVLLVKLLRLFNISIDVLNLWAIEYSVSPLDTLYVFITTSFGSVYGIFL